MSTNVSPAARELADKLAETADQFEALENRQILFAQLIQFAVKELVPFMRHKRECIMDGASETAKQHLMCSCGLIAALAPWEVPDVKS